MNGRLRHLLSVTLLACTTASEKTQDTKVGTFSFAKDSATIAINVPFLAHGSSVKITHLKAGKCDKPTDADLIKNMPHEKYLDLDAKKGRSLLAGIVNRFVVIESVDVVVNVPKCGIDKNDVIELSIEFQEPGKNAFSPYKFEVKLNSEYTYDVDVSYENAIVGDTKTRPVETSQNALVPLTVEFATVRSKI